MVKTMREKNVIAAVLTYKYSSAHKYCKPSATVMRKMRATNEKRPKEEKHWLKTPYSSAGIYPFYVFVVVYAIVRRD